MSVYETIKRIVDLVIAVTILFIGSFPMLIIALIVKATSPGPVLYKGIRVGKGGKIFNLFKFRTMLINAPALRNLDGSFVTSANDPRITKFGWYLRKTSLDELPQLINIIKGDMSLVGPRPDPLSALEYYRTKDYNRLLVLPGITGWAQINGRNQLSWERRRELDLEYINKCGLLLDLYIILRTIPIVIMGKGVFITQDEEVNRK